MDLSHGSHNVYVFFLAVCASVCCKMLWDLRRSQQFCNSLHVYHYVAWCEWSKNWLTIIRRDLWSIHMEMMAYKRCLMDFNHHLEEKNMEMGQEHPRCLLPSGVEPKLISFQFPNEFRRQLEIWWLRELRHQREFVHCELEFGSCSTQSWVAGWWCHPRSYVTMAIWYMHETLTYMSFICHCQMIWHDMTRNDMTKTPKNDLNNQNLR